MTPEIEALYQSIGAELVSVPQEPFESIVLYAEVEDGVLSANVFYAVPGADKIIYRVGTGALEDLVYELWEKWGSLPGQEPWRALLYTAHGGKFRIEMTYADQFDEKLGEAERRLRAIQPVLGKREVDYSRA